MAVGTKGAGVAGSDREAVASPSDNRRHAHEGAGPVQSGDRHGHACNPRGRGGAAPALPVGALLGVGDFTGTGRAATAGCGHGRGGSAGGREGGGVSGGREAPKRERTGWLSREGEGRRG